jgi:hypothetical protein
MKIARLKAVTFAYSHRAKSIGGGPAWWTRSQA